MSESNNMPQVKGLFHHLKNAPTKAQLQQAAQLAIQVEFTTIPAYLTALYSITDTASNAYQTLRSVAMEEMFHVNQAANILVGLGGFPKFTGHYAPSYPGYLPHANPKTTPLVGLFRASPEVFENVFAAIETPAPADALPEGDNYNTIAQLYEALKQGVHKFNGNPFDSATLSRQRTDIYLGKFGGDVLTVVDKSSFDQAVIQIVKQGEGTVPLSAPLEPIQQYGAYNHYGTRTDGTYGPILGTPFELSHFKKFRQVAMDSANFPNTLPILSNPCSEDYSNPLAKQLDTDFNDYYSFMLEAFELTFSEKDGSDWYFWIVLNIMHQILPNLARSLMTTPIFKNGDANVGPNASPTWTYTPKFKTQLSAEGSNKTEKLTAIATKLVTQTNQTIELLYESPLKSDVIQLILSPLNKALEGAQKLTTNASA